MRAVHTLLGLALLPLLACEQRHEGFIRDAQGRALVLHGMNVSGGAKDDPQGMPWIAEADAHDLSRRWGFNVARFLIFWQHAEPQPGVYDEVYLDRVAERVRWLSDAGVHVILDMHQDVYGKQDSIGRTIGFDGAPSWALITDGLPYQQIQPWSFNYFSAAVIRAFDHFWQGDAGAHPELQRHYTAMWRHIAARFANDPAVIGYDLMNEPFAGSEYGFVVPGPLPVLLGDPARQAVFEATTLRAFSERVIAAIREVDAEKWIFYEPTLLGANWGAHASLPPPADPRPGGARVAYFPHYYSLLMEITGAYNTATDTSVRDWAQSRRGELAGTGVPLLIGEWGAGPEFQNYQQNLADCVDMADEVTSGWTYWSHDHGSWSILKSDGSETAHAHLLVRSYPQRVAGTPLAYDYDRDTRQFAMAWREEPGTSGPTEIYVPAARFYPNGFDVQMTDAPGTWSSQWDGAREVLQVTADPARGEHVIRIVPR